MYGESLLAYRRPCIAKCFENKQSVKNGKTPIMGRITINGTQAGFSCKKEMSLALWDVKTNRAKGKSEEARTLNQELDNIKAQITRHYQYICDHDSFVTAKKVYNRYVGFSEECHTLMNLFREQLEPYKKKIGIEKAESTYCGLVADYKSLLLFMKSKKNAEDIVIEELEKTSIYLNVLNKNNKGPICKHRPFVVQY